MNYSAISHIANAVLLNRAEGAFIACMTEYVAYLDDGGHPVDQAVVLVAGFVSSVEQWKRFESEWFEVLDKYQIPDRVFHMTDFESRHKESFFAGWSQHWGIRSKVNAIPV